MVRTTFQCDGLNRGHYRADTGTCGCQFGAGRRLFMGERQFGPAKQVKLSRSSTAQFVASASVHFSCKKECRPTFKGSEPTKSSPRRSLSRDRNAGQEPYP